MSITASEAQMSSVDTLRSFVSTLRTTDVAKMLGEVRKAYSRWFQTTDRRIDALLLSAAIAGGKITPGLFDEYALAVGASSATPPGSPPPPPASGHTSNDAVVQRARAAKDEFSSLKSMLESYWKGADVLVDSWVHDVGDKEGRAFWAEKIARAIKGSKPLTFGVIGSSVAAGHDNCACVAPPMFHSVPWCYTRFYGGILCSFVLIPT
jgi:hypothetical protein